MVSLYSLRNIIEKAAIRLLVALDVGTGRICKDMRCMSVENSSYVTWNSRTQIPPAESQRALSLLTTVLEAAEGTVAKHIIEHGSRHILHGTVSILKL